MNKLKGLKRGFTLIELLVVIAIIGVLSSIVVASLNTAGTKGKDSAIKGNLASVRTAAAIYYDTNNNYGTAAHAIGACAATASSLFADPTVFGAVTNAINARGTTVGKSACYSGTGTDGKWAAVVQLTTATKAWCVDSSGVAKEETVADTQLGLSGAISTDKCL